MVACRERGAIAWPGAPSSHAVAGDVDVGRKQPPAMQQRRREAKGQPLRDPIGNHQVMLHVAIPVIRGQSKLCTEASRVTPSCITTQAFAVISGGRMLRT